MSKVEPCRKVVVKIGGSAITDKTLAKKAREDVIEKVAEILKENWSERKQFVLVHGGGSFGHYEVKTILDEKSILDPADSARIQLAMLELSLILTSKLIEKGLPVTIHPPHTLCPEGELSSCNFKPVLHSLYLGLIPLTYGDAIPREDGVYIISGDDLAAALAGLIGAHCLIYVIEEPGILDEEGRIIRYLTAPGQVKPVSKEGYIDVTGGIMRKIETALQVSKESETLIVFTNVEGLRRLLKGDDPSTVGTIIKR